MFKNNVRDIYSASPKLCIFFVLILSYVQLYTLFLSYEYIILLSLKHILSVTLITTPSWDLQVVAYLKLMEVYGRENGGGVFLWLVSNIKVLVTALYVMGKCRTGVFMSVFCDARDSMDSQHNEVGHRDSAVSLYFRETAHFILVEEQNVFKNNVRDIYSASPKLCIFFVVKVSYVQLCTLFLSYEYIILLSLKHIRHVTLITTPSWNLQVVAYLKLMEV